MVNDFGFDANTLPPELMGEARALAQKQRLAEVLMQQSMKPAQAPTSKGRFAVPINPLSGVAQVAQAYLGARQMDDSQKGFADLATRNASLQADAIRDYTARRVGTPEQTIAPDPQEAQQSADLGTPEVGSATVPARATDPNGAMIQAMMSRYPALQKIGQMDYTAAAKLNEPYTLAPGASRYAAGGKVVATAPVKPEPFTLPPGATRYAADGTIVKAAPDKPIIEHNFSVGGNQVQPHISLDGGNTWSPVPGSKPSAKFSNQVVNVNAQPREEPAPVAIVGPDGKPVLVARRDAIGRVPYASDPTAIGAQAAARAGGKVEGEGAATARLTLPQVEAQAQEGIRLIDDLVKHPGKGYAVGPGSIAQSYRVPGTPGADFKARLDQVKGQQFLAAFNSLKGGGQITEVEGKKATDAIARMQQSTSIKEFDTAAAEYQKVLRDGLERAKRQATPQRRASDAAPAARVVDW